jgi:coenzyme Q-binding protein COQ10
MHRFDETRVLPYSPKQLYDLVADIGKYPDFLPWCRGARVGERLGDELTADLIVGNQFFRETFKGPMRHMENHWVFAKASEDEGAGTRLEFHVAFEFSSLILEKMMGAFFDEASRRMISAFETRAVQLHGDPLQ